ncbi:hypothetical protein LCGC14_1389140 [marine sediment metagenome]|uniref:Uncharacterized protein n=1 Tax=marine sediment metagenome TaxID=412755 RepID=A0A0F9K0H4_9ZZZZ
MKWIPIILMVLMIAFVDAAQDSNVNIFDTNEVFDLSVHLNNENGDVLGANCSIQIRNNSFDVLVDDNMNEVNGGWYNFTYNTSKVGKHLCRTNCTKSGEFTAGNCDFIIEAIELEESNKMIFLFALMFGIALVLLVLALFKEDVTFAALSGMLFVLTALFLWFNGVDLGDRTLNNFWTQGSALIIFGLGLYLLIRSTMEQAQEDMDNLER